MYAFLPACANVWTSPIRSLPRSAASTVAEVWQRVLGDIEPPVNMLIAVNMEYADIHAPVRDGDEVAFFPPVTGG